MRLSRTLIAVAATGTALLGLTACTAGSTTAEASNSAEPVASVNEKTVVDAKRLGDDAAMDAAGAALAKCKADGIGFVSVSVVDRSGQLQAFVRGDNAAAHTIEASRQKAYTAAAFGAPTSELAKRATGDNAASRTCPTPSSSRAGSRWRPARPPSAASASAAPRPATRTRPAPRPVSTPSASRTAAQGGLEARITLPCSAQARHRVAS